MSYIKTIQIKGCINKSYITLKYINMKKIILIIILSLVQRITYSQTKIPTELPEKSDIIKLYSTKPKKEYLKYFLENLQEYGFEIDKVEDSFGSYSTGYKVIVDGSYPSGTVGYRIYGFIKQVKDTSVLVVQGNVKTSTVGYGVFQSMLVGDSQRMIVSRYSFNEILKIINKLDFDRVEVYSSINLENKKEKQKSYEDYK